MRYLLPLLLSLATVSCSTSQPTPNDIDPVPPSRLMLYQNTPTTPYATLVVIRDKGWLAGACRIGVMIDNEFAGSIASAEKAEFLVPVGQHTVSLGQDGFYNPCIWRDASGSQTPSLKAGETRFLRISGSTSAGFTLHPASGFAAR
ncbi:MULTISPECIES: hypothetical protein [unclassified Brenneria]|uniref:hypothetical protein n=1 Tax=unclassified Brenneria TaxID=2634434 RepID=UPI00155335DB|nr:hypothetical protein [Brenneria sp. hezel4-2-4]MEE3652608.1 hypothetical protein [Brenneria sp. HEZEL_4_2_4]